MKWLPFFPEGRAWLLTSESNSIKYCRVDPINVDWGVVALVFRVTVLHGSIHNVSREVHILVAGYWDLFVEILQRS